MSCKQDSGRMAALDGKQAVADDPSGTDRQASGARHAVDPEERPTELWAPSARTLFQREALAPAQEDAEDQQQLNPRAGEIVLSEPEEAATEMMHGPPPSLGLADTVKMTSEEAAAAIAEAEAEAARLLSDTVEVTGAEGAAARKLALEQRLKDPSATLVLDKPPLPQLNRECRMCGKKVMSPLPTRLRGPKDSDRGFRCEKCSNIFCAAHVVRVSNLVESLMSGARFRCQLCMLGGNNKQ